MPLNIIENVYRMQDTLQKQECKFLLFSGVYFYVANGSINVISIKVNQKIQKHSTKHILRALFV